MDLSVSLYIALLGLVGAGRLVEMRISRRHQRALAARGASKAAEPHFRWMVLLHSGVLVASALEAWLLRRPLIPALALAMGLLLVLANLLRWWVIRTMAEHWNVQVVNSLGLGVVTHGPFRWVRHPNYLAVFAELFALPLLHSAWLTALLGTLAHIWILGKRIALEESLLLANADYQRLMAGKPRFLPRVRRHG